MASTPVDIIPSTTLNTSASIYYTTPAGKTTVIKKISFTNITTNIVKVTLHKVVSGAPAGSINILANEKPLDANETWSCPDIEGKVLEAGDSIQAKADAINSVNIDGAGTEVD